MNLRVFFIYICKTAHFGWLQLNDETWGGRDNEETGQQANPTSLTSRSAGSPLRCAKRLPTGSPATQRGDKHGRSA